MEKEIYVSQLIQLKEKMNVLFLTMIYQHAKEMFPVMRHFKKMGCQVSVLIGWRGVHESEYQTQCESEGCVIYHVPEQWKYAMFNDAKRNTEIVQSFWQGVGTMFRKPLSLGKLMSDINKKKKYVEYLLAEIKPDVVFGSSFQSCGKVEDIMAIFCNKHNILFCCLPYTEEWGEHDTILVQFEYLKLGTLSDNINVKYTAINRILAFIFPHWTRTYEDKAFFIRDPKLMFAAWLIGIHPKNPWQKPSELYDIVFSFSEFAKNTLITDNYDASKIVVSGRPMLDSVFENLSNKDYIKELYDYLRLSINEPFVLFNCEPAAQHFYCSWDKHWEYFKTLMDCLKRAGVKTVLSLHPLCKADDYMFVEKEYGFKISLKYKIDELYPYCAVSVSYLCATNALSAIFEKKLIIYDLFGACAGNEPWGARVLTVWQPVVVDTAEKIYDELIKFIKSEDSYKPIDYSKKSLKYAKACENIYETVASKINRHREPDNIIG